MDFLEKNKKKLMVALLVLAAALAAIGYLVLPDRLVMQLTFSGEAGNTMNKPLGLLLPFALTSVFAVLQGNADDRRDQWKYFFVSVIGLVVYGFTFAVNLLAV